MANVKLRYKQADKNMTIFKIYDKNDNKFRSYEFFMKPNGTQKEVPVKDYLAEIMVLNNDLEVVV